MPLVEIGLIKALSAEAFAIVTQTRRDSDLIIEETAQRRYCFRIGNFYFPERNAPGNGSGLGLRAISRSKRPTFPIDPSDELTPSPIKFLFTVLV